MNYEEFMAAPNEGDAPKEEEMTYEQFMAHGEEQPQQGQPQPVQQPKQPQQPEPSAGEYLKDRAKIGVSGLISLPGMPAAMATSAINFLAEQAGLPKIVQAGGVGDLANAAQELVGVEHLKTEDDALRYAGGAVEFASGSVIPGAFVVSKVPSITGKVLTAGTELLSATLGGGGMELGGDVAEGVGVDRAYGEVPAAVAGTMTPYAVPRAIQPIFARLKAYFSPETQKALGKQAAANIISKELEEVPDAMANLKRSEQLRENIPGYSPTLGDSTDAVGIQSLEKRFAESSQEGFTKAQQAEKLSTDAIRKKYQEVFKETQSNISTIPTRRLAAVRTSLVQKEAKIGKQITELESKITTKNAEKIGQDLRKLRQEQQVVARGVKNSKYIDFYKAADDARITFAPEEFGVWADDILKAEGMTFQDKSPVLKQIASKYAAKPKESYGLLDASGRPVPSVAVRHDPIRMEEFHSMLKEVRREYRMASRSATKDPALINQLGNIKNKFESMLDSFKDHSFGNVATKLDEADAFYMDKYQRVFKEGVGGRMVNSNQYGKATPDESIVTKLVLGRDSGLDDFYNIYGESQEAQMLLENGILDAFARKAIKGGTYQEGAASTFLKVHQDKLTKIPNLQKLLQSKQDTYQALVNRRGFIEAKKIALNKSKLQAVTGYRDTETLIASAIKDPAKMAVLDRTVTKSGKEGMEALQSGVASHILKQQEPYKYFRENRTVLHSLYKHNPKHFRDLLDLAEAKEILTRKFNVRQVETSLGAKDPIKEAIGTSFRESATLLRHVSSGWISPEYALSHVGSKALFKVRQDEMNKLIENAFYDPEVAKLLLEGVKEGVKIKPDYLFRLKDRLYSIGANTNLAFTAQDDELEE